ncbi:hypothetical protein FS837_000654 [Tulasnella sp. UAMH 9824]|nr:hypothetical protein FS837_000654 [Tulasnella sp. UAMH 9824]
MSSSVYTPFTSSTDGRLPEPPSPKSPGDPAPVVVYKIDWSAVGFPEYKGKFALVLDNVFSPAECAKLLEAAESAGTWSVAKVHADPETGIETGFVDMRYRNSGRIMLDDFELSDWILNKLRPYIEEIEFVPSGKFRMFNRSPENKDVVQVQLSRLNERLRFLRYGPGEFFARHCDGTYFTADRSEVSYFTLQIYLNGDPKTLKGGPTRFVSLQPKPPGHPGHLDVDPRMGRAIVFQQAGLLHSGEEVLEGEKFAMRTDLMYKRVAPPPKPSKKECVSSSDESD